jgi:hypothetical protein
MEKLVYVLWKEDAAESGAFAQRLLGELVPDLQAVGAGLIEISVADDAVAAGVKLRLDSPDSLGRSKDAVVSFWLEAAQDRDACEALLAAECAQLAGYLVVESRPLLAEREVDPGERTPGFNLCTCIVPREDLRYERFLELWHVEHRKCAVETQSTFSYVRNEIVRALTPDAPAWAAIVEEGFPIGALDDPAVFYDAVGDAERLAANQQRMFESVRAFLALDRVDSHPMSQYVF